MALVRLLRGGAAGPPAAIWEATWRRTADRALTRCVRRRGRAACAASSGRPADRRAIVGPVRFSLSVVAGLGRNPVPREIGIGGNVFVERPTSAQRHGGRRARHGQFQVPHHLTLQKELCVKSSDGTQNVSFATPGPLASGFERLVFAGRHELHDLIAFDVAPRFHHSLDYQLPDGCGPRRPRFGLDGYPSVKHPELLGLEANLDLHALPGSRPPGTFFGTGY